LKAESILKLFWKCDNGPEKSQLCDVSKADTMWKTRKYESWLISMETRRVMMKGKDSLEM